MDNSYLSFDTGIDDDRVYAHRGDIFICDDLFKSIDEIDKDDHILGKPSRPVIIISNDKKVQVHVIVVISYIFVVVSSSEFLITHL